MSENINLVEECEQVLGLRYNAEYKVIELAIKSKDASIEMALKLHEALDLSKGLCEIIEEARQEEERLNEIELEKQDQDLEKENEV